MLEISIEAQRHRPLLTPRNRTFCKALVRAVGTRPIIFTGVNLAHLVQDPTIGDDVKRRLWADFVLCRPSDLSYMLVIKLESRKERRMRHIGHPDVLGETLANSRIPLLRIQSALDYDPVRLRHKIRRMLARDPRRRGAENCNTEEIYIRTLDGEARASANMKQHRAYS